MTLADRAYRLVCVFKSPVALTNFLEIRYKFAWDNAAFWKYKHIFSRSVLPTVDLHNTFSSPICTYTIRHDSINGHLARFTSIGDLLYHVWECDNSMKRMIYELFLISWRLFFVSCRKLWFAGSRLFGGRRSRESSSIIGWSRVNLRKKNV